MWLMKLYTCRLLPTAHVGLMLSITDVATASQSTLEDTAEYP